MRCPNCEEENSLIPIQKDHVFTYRTKKLKTIVYGHRCMICKESFTDPLDHKYDEKVDAFIIRVNEETAHYTCASCATVDDCPVRWDLYNINGDCLWSK